MSIALATICTDGLVVCADTLVTVGEHVKYHERKVSQIPYKLLSKAVVLSYAGSPEKMRVINQELLTRLCGPDDKTAQEIGQHFRDVLNDAFPGKTKENHQILFGFTEAKNFFLFKSRDKEIFPVDAWDCAGWGDSPLVRYLARIFLEGSVHLPVCMAVPICNYIIAQAKKYVPYCGGDTNLLVLTPEGKVHAQIQNLQIDALCGRIEDGINGMLTSAIMYQLGEEQCLRLIGELRALIEQSTAIFNSFIPPLP